MRSKLMLFGVLLLSMVMATCGIDNKPVSSESSPETLMVTLKISPPTSLRTLETWNFWNVPMETAFLVASGNVTDEEGHDDDHTHGIGGALTPPDNNVALLKVTDGDDGSPELTGSINLNGMTVNMTITGGMTLWEFEHGGEMHEHHADADEHHVEVELNETATGHHAHGGATVSHCEVTLIAVSDANDTTEIPLIPVQGGHGFRYENNAALPVGEYDLHLEIEPPTFLRTDYTMEKWISDAEAEFDGFSIEENIQSTTVGSELWIGPDNDSLLITLRAGAVKTYGALGMGAVPLEEGDNINFSLRLEDPSLEAHAQSLHGASILATIVNSESGTVATAMLNPVYGEHGFYFGGNMTLGLGAITGGDEHADDGHDHDGGH